MHPTQNWEIRKPGVSSRGGIVAAQNGTAASVGAEVLAAGGTAVDAVVATAFALAAVEPWNSGLGGIGFMVVHRAGATGAEAVDFGPAAPHGLDPRAFPLTGEMKTELFTWPRVVDDRNMHGPLSFATPSAVRGYALAVERFGRLPWRELVKPATALARAGLPVDWFTTIKVAGAATDLARYEESRRVWLPDGLPPVCPPDRDSMSLPLGRLPETLERLESMGDVETGSRTSTTHITAADRNGGIAALTTTLLSSFGSRYVLAGTGILMNNGVMWFDPRPGRPNSMAPGKRALTNMCPVVAARDGRPWFGVGASGGRRILGAVLQLASFIVDFGMDLETAAHHPRIDVSGTDQIGIDRRLPAGIVRRLSTRPGARIVEHTVYPSRFACPNLVLRGSDGLNHGISDAMSPWSAAVAEPGSA